MTAALKRGARRSRRQPQHVQLAAGQAVGSEAVGEQAAGNRRPGRPRSASACERAARGLDRGRLHRPDERLVEERRRRALRRASGRAQGSPARDSTRSSCGLHRAARRPLRAQHRKTVERARPRAARSPRPSRWRERPPAPPRASGRRAATARAPMLDADARGGATSAQMSRERIARRQHSPRCCPVTVTKPKLRIDAPLACASRSITATLSPRRAAASAWARPQIPAPTTARSNRPSAAFTVCARPARGRGTPG